MSASRQVLSYVGLPVGLVKIDKCHTEFNFQQAYTFLKAMIKEWLEREIEPRVFNRKIVAAIELASPHGRGGQYSVCWVAMKFLEELWNMTFTIQSPWVNFLNRLKMKNLNSPDDLMVSGSSFTDCIVGGPMTPEEMVLDIFRYKFPIIW
ncbi:hypothetical protein F5Y05DRAFT_419803 [Hypoxylon sp. FL0543]|nr:hypothetical protein F5Y05DRAFT_419803 [Hypoxylon sp. FL0543]